LQNVIAIPPVRYRMVSQVLTKMKKKGKKEKKQIIFPKKAYKNITVWLGILLDVRECFENIKEHLFVSMKAANKTPYVLAVTSCHRGEGVSTVATGIAYAVAQHEKENVLLVDANLHNPEIDKVTGINRPPGLFEITIKKEMQKINGEEDINISTGDMSDYISKIEGSEKINKMVPALQKFNYKIIVLDLPAISEGVSAAKSAGNADGTILVIESEKVRREVVAHAKEMLKRHGANLFGVVLNKRKYYIPKWVYGRV